MRDTVRKLGTQIKSDVLATLVILMPDKKTGPEKGVITKGAPS